MHKYASAEEHRMKNQKTTVCHYGFTEKVYKLPCTVRTARVAMQKRRTALSRMTRDAKCKKASRHTEDSA